MSEESFRLLADKLRVQLKIKPRAPKKTGGIISVELRLSLTLKLADIATGFAAKSPPGHMWGCVGPLDGIAIRMWSYYNRKGFHATNTHVPQSPIAVAHL